MRIIEILTESTGNRVLKTLNGSAIKRSPKHGVGKMMGGALYVHANYENVLPDISQFKEILEQQYPDFKYNIIKYSPNAVSFLYSPDFDSANEPVISEYVTVKSDGNTKRGRTKTIYHHKWLFVGDDYTGFDVDAAFERSRAWLQIPDIDFCRIGSSREFWINFLKSNSEHLPKDFVFESEYYAKAPLETGGTSTNFNSPAPAVKQLVKSGVIQQGHTALDYGAGKYGRNANFLREQGIRTFAYDPFNGTGNDGWTGVSTTLGGQGFDVAFTSYVLNVVPKHIEQQILQEIEGKAERVVHIVRNRDVFDSVKKALLRKEKTVWAFFENEYLPNRDFEFNGEITDELVEDLCRFGVQTSRGFQRICYLEDSGYSLIKGSATSPYKVYQK